MGWFNGFVHSVTGFVHSAARAVGRAIHKVSHLARSVLHRHSRHSWHSHKSYHSYYHHSHHYHSYHHTSYHHTHHHRSIISGIVGSIGRVVHKAYNSVKAMFHHHRSHYHSYHHHSYYNHGYYHSHHRGAFSGFVDTARRAFGGVNKTLHRAVNRVIGAVNGVARWVGSVVGRAIPSVGHAFSHARKRIFGFVSRIGHSWRRFSHNVRNGIGSFVHGIKSFVSRAGRWIGSVISGVRHWNGFWGGFKRIHSFVDRHPWIIPAVTVPTIVGGAMLVGNAFIHSAPQPHGLPSVGSGASGNAQLFIPGRDVFNPSPGEGNGLLWQLLLGLGMGLGIAGVSIGLGHGLGIFSRSQGGMDEEGLGREIQPRGNIGEKITIIKSLISSILHRNTVIAAKKDADILQEVLDEMSPSEKEKYADLVKEAEDLIKWENDVYYSYRFNVKKQQVEKILRSGDFAQITGLQFSTEGLSFDDPLGLVTIGHMVANKLGLESDGQAYEAIVNMKTREMIELEDSMGTAQNPNWVGVAERMLFNPLTLAGGFVVGGEAIGGAMARVPGGAFIDKALAVDWGASVADSAMRKDWESVWRDLAFGFVVGGISSKVKITPKDLEKVKVLAEGLGFNEDFNTYLEYARNAEGSNWKEIDNLKHLIGRIEKLKNKGTTKLKDLMNDDGIKDHLRGLYAELEVFIELFDEKLPRWFVDYEGGDAIGYINGKKHLVEVKASSLGVKRLFTTKDGINQLKGLIYNTKKEKAIPAIAYKYNEGRFVPELRDTLRRLSKEFKTNLLEEVKVYRVYKKGNKKKIKEIKSLKRDAYGRRRKSK